MRAFPILLLIGLSGITQTAAAEDMLSSRSAGKLQADTSLDLRQVLEESEPVTRAKPGRDESYAVSPDAARQAGIANRYDQLFEIYDADAVLLSDLDGDGFHHALNVYFDVDVNYDGATVYAKLYLSREGGPWHQYFTTDLFHIHGDDLGDAYEVETELIDGYEPGYYAVLIEIYSLDHAYMVASEVLDYHYLGRDLPLEDYYRDEPYEYYDSYSVSVSGSGASDAGGLLLMLLLVQVVIAARGFLAQTPLQINATRRKTI